MRYILLLLLSTAYAKICLEDQYVTNGYISSTSVFTGNVCSTDCETQCSADASCEGYSDSTLIDGAVGWGYSIGITTSKTLVYFGSVSHSDFNTVNGTQNVDSVDSSIDYACFLISGTKTCLGLDSSGQLGDPLSGIVQISTGRYHTCALMSDSGIKCWGWRDKNRLGDGSTSGSTSTPVDVPNTGYSKVSAGWKHSCAIQGTSVVCWGENYYCAYSYEDYSIAINMCKNDYTTLVTTSWSNVLDVDVGVGFTCVVTSDNKVSCRGNNQYGKLGIGNTNTGFYGGSYRPEEAYVTPTPELVKKSDGSTLTNIQSIALGYDHGCALDLSGQAWCWGSIYSNNPYASVQKTSVSKISADYDHTCFILNDGSMDCHGSVLEGVFTAPEDGTYGTEISSTGGTNSFEKGFFCESCPTGRTNQAGDDTTAGSTTCDIAPGYMITSGTDPDACAANYKVESGACVPCDPGTENAQGDDFTGANTTCDAIICETNQYVSNNICTNCTSYSYPKLQGDDASGADTQCQCEVYSTWNGTACLCNEDTYFSNEYCRYCEAGYYNDAGDDPLGGDTVCDKCDANYKSQGGLCVECSTGSTNAQGDSLASDTTCDISPGYVSSTSTDVPDQCDTNYKVGGGLCVACPTDIVTTTNLAGDLMSGGDTLCDLPDGYVSSTSTDVPDQCTANYKVVSNECVECDPGTENAEGDDFTGGNTTCDPILCPENHHVVNHVCTPCDPGYLHPPGDDASVGDTQCTLCNTNYKVQGGSCVACLSSFSNVAGDPISGGDTYCDCPSHANFIEANNSCACIENYFVNQNNECQYCGTGFFNQPGDDPSGSETSCYQKICSENEHVQSGECVTCPVGTTNPAGDGTAQGDSQCTPDFCDLNQYVSGNTCVDCATGYGNPAGDPTSGPDTSCSFIPCAQNHHMSGGLCVACPSGAVRQAGDSDPTIDTFCKCPIDHYVSSGTCQACSSDKTNAPGDDPSGSDTQCEFKVCGKNEYASGGQCLKCDSGSYNNPGDSVEFDTTCDDTQICDNDQYADGTQCLPCPAGESNPAGDLATTVTSCTTDLCTTCCAMNEHVVNGACQACPDGLTNIAGDNPLAGNTDCDDVVCEENFFAVGDGECDRCPEGSFNLAGDIAKEGFTIKPATSCCPAGQFEHMVDLSLGTRECRDCSEIRDRFSMLNCCRGTDLSGQVSQLCDRVLDYYKKVCQPLESADVCPVQNYV